MSDAGAIVDVTVAGRLRWFRRDADLLSHRGSFRRSISRRLLDYRGGRVCGVRLGVGILQRRLRYFFFGQIPVVILPFPPTILPVAMLCGLQLCWGGGSFL